MIVSDERPQKQNRCNLRETDEGAVTRKIKRARDDPEITTVTGIVVAKRLEN